MAIIPSLPITLVNGTLADATQVMADFLAIVNAVNANAAHSGANSDITSITGLTTPLAVIYGGTGAATASNARANLAAAASGANTDITSLGGLTTPIPVEEGGTGANTPGPTAANNIGAAALGANSDITSLSGLTTPLPISEGGTGANNAPQALINLGAVSLANPVTSLAKMQYNGVTDTIVSQTNIASVVKNGVGQYTVNFQNAVPFGSMPTLTWGNHNSWMWVENVTTNSVQIFQSSSTGGQQDDQLICFTMQ